MTSEFENSTFARILRKRPMSTEAPVAILGGVTGSRFSPNERISNLPFVVFDFETTGLDAKNDRIIEIGAVRFENRKEVARMSQLVNPKIALPPKIIEITGITDADLQDQPSIETVLANLHDLMRGSVLVAHNADFDLGFLVQESARIGMQCAYQNICTLKMARVLVKCERKNLDALAEHYGLVFESRHRSIGDILVTAQVLWRMLDDNSQFKTLADLESFKQVMLDLK